MACIFLILITVADTVWSENIDPIILNRIEACSDLNCDTSSDINVCGIRNEMSTVRLKLFSNECALLKYGCSVPEKYAYGLINIEYCNRTHTVDEIEDTRRHDLQIKRNYDNVNRNCELNCNNSYDDFICGIRQDGEGYRIKLFKNACELKKNNCNNTFPYIRTDMYICEGTFQVPNTSSANLNNSKVLQTARNDITLGNSKSIVVVDGSMLGQISDANETIENFFAATHVLDLPIKELDKNDLKTRRMLVKNLGPVMVFQPWITIPKKIEEDYYHMPTLSTCFHKCPTKCPDTYSPVCGVPGIIAREPSLMFQNHCYMDVAQCKMFWENKSSTAASSSYIESSFLFCLGDQLNGMYRFLPLIKTLQHMGRLKKKGKFRYRLKNMRFFNNYAYKEPKIMG